MLIHIIWYPWLKSSCHTIVWNSNHWILHTKQKQACRYDHLRVVCDLGLFFILRFSHGQGKKIVLLFQDQLDNEHSRLLHLLAKIKAL